MYNLNFDIWKFGHPQCANSANGALSSFDISGNGLETADILLFAQHSAILDEDSRALLEAEGQDSNALSGGTFVPKPLKKWDSKAALAFSVLSGYFDVYADVAGAFCSIFQSPLGQHIT